MLKVDSSNLGVRHGVTIYAQGNIIEIMAEVARVVGGVYMQLKRSDPTIARIYRTEMIRLLTDPDTPLWTDDPNADGVTIIAPNNKEED